jgi:hypothetical protein
LSRHPSFEAELGFAVARGRMPIDLADMSILARYRDMDEAAAKAREVRRLAKAWEHTFDSIATRIRDEVRMQMRAGAPKNVILARCHDVNAQQFMAEQQVNEIAVNEVWRNLPEAPGRRRGR